MVEQNAFLDKAKEIARDLVWDFYQKCKSIWKIMEQMDEKNFSWIGAGPEEYLRSYDEALHYFAEQRQSGAVPLIAISEERYDAQPIGSRACVVLCEYLLTVQLEEKKNVMQERQRSTVTIRWERGKFKICQVHTSNPWHAMKGDERWPEEFGRQTYTYFLNLLSELELKEIPHLSSQQRKVLVLMMHGKTYQEISAAIGITYRTVQYHVRMIFNKFNVDCREMLFAKLIRALCTTGPLLDSEGDASHDVLKVLDRVAKKCEAGQAERAPHDKEQKKK